MSMQVTRIDALRVLPGTNVLYDYLPAVGKNRMTRLTVEHARSDPDIDAEQRSKKLAKFAKKQLQWEKVRLVCWAEHSLSTIITEHEEYLNSPGSSMFVL